MRAPAALRAALRLLSQLCFGFGPLLSAGSKAHFAQAHHHLTPSHTTCSAILFVVVVLPLAFVVALIFRSRPTNFITIIINIIIVFKIITNNTNISIQLDESKMLAICVSSV